MCEGLPVPTCLSLLHLCLLPASPVAFLPLPTPPACPCLPASAVFVCVYTRERQTMAREPRMVYMFLMVGEKHFKKNISLLVEVI